MYTKLDMYDYELNYIAGGFGGSLLFVRITLDGPNDPVISDILSELSQEPKATCEGYLFEVDPTEAYVVEENGTYKLILESRRVNVRGKNAV